MTVEVVGVRHHSPACARLVEHRIHQSRPDFVLVEGPADFNHRMGELLLEHEPPLALFSYYQDGAFSRSSWSPFCAYSPEWVALRVGAEVGAELRFMDLPAWTRPFFEVENRYADHDRPRLDLVGELQKRLGMDGMDALWDHLFEQVEEPELLATRLTHYFDQLRQAEPDESDAEREQFMAQCLSWAAHKGRVVAVCGGFHKPYLEKAWRQQPGDQWPAVPSFEGRYGTFLVAYSFRRLDSFTGYQAGMPSPAYYQAVWEEGLEGAAERLVGETARNLRTLKQPVSTADLVAARTLTEGLMRLRGHDQPTRSDLLDGLAGALVKDALEVPLPWTQRGPLPPRTHPMVVEMVKAFSGQTRGRLDPKTPLPPLVAAVRAGLEEFDLTPHSRSRTVECSPGSAKSHFLHRCRLLSLPGFELESEAEEWTIRVHELFDSALIEAGAWGPDLATAAAARLEETIALCQGQLDAVAKTLLGAAQSGLRDLSDRCLKLLRVQAESEVRFARLGSALTTLLVLWRKLPTDSLMRVLEMLVERGLWLFEGLAGEKLPADPDLVAGVAAVRDAYRLLEWEPEPGLAVMRRKALQKEAPPTSRGAALGFLWSLEDGSQGQLALSSIQTCRKPVELGDYLAGLFGLAREETVYSEGLLEAIDEVVLQFTQEEFLEAIPSLRLAFNYFPPREREVLAGRLFEQPHTVLTLDGDPEQVLENHRLEQKVDHLLERYGLC